MDMNTPIGKMAISREEGEEIKKLLFQNMEDLQKQLEKAPRVAETKEELLKKILNEAQKTNANLKALITCIKRENHGMANPEDSDFQGK